jgi:hypothetical protein
VRRPCQSADGETDRDRQEHRRNENFEDLIGLEREVGCTALSRRVQKGISSGSIVAVRSSAPNAVPAAPATERVVSSSNGIPGQTAINISVLALSPLTSNARTTKIVTSGTATQTTPSVRRNSAGRFRTRRSDPGPRRSAPPNITAMVAVHAIVFMRTKVVLTLIRALAVHAVYR